MKKGVTTRAIPHVPPLALWIAFTALCGLGCLTTLIDLKQLPSREQARAATLRQHLRIDPVTGEVMTAAGAKDKKTAQNHAPADEDAHADTPAADAKSADAEPGDAHHDEKHGDEHDGEKDAKHPDPHGQATAADDAHTKPPEETKEGDHEKPTSDAQHEADAHPKDHAAPEADAAHPPTAHDGHAASTSPHGKPATATGDMPALRTTPLVTRLEEVPTRTGESLVPAPAREVTETVGELKLPMRASQEVFPAGLYARPFKPKPEQIPISFVVTDVGLDPQSIGGVLSLPGPVTAAYSPYVKPDASYSESLRAAGHEVWIMLPAMTERYPNEDPGPLGLIAQMPGEEVMRRLHDMLTRIPGAVGFVLPHNETIGTHKGALAAVLHELHARGLYLLSGNSARTVDQISSDKQFKRMLVRADLVLDAEPNETEITRKLEGLLAAAQGKGRYLVLVSARPQSLQLLGDWLKKTPLPEPFVLAPASGFYRKPAAPAEGGEAGHGTEAPADAHGSDDGHGGGGEKKEKKKKEPKEKPRKPLPQDEYLKPAGEKKDGGGGH